jgi:putative RecB family exonuclease
MRDHISVSQINQYLMCPLKYRFNYIDELPKPFKSVDLAFGSAIHAAAEWWHKHRTNGTGPEWRDTVRIFEADLQAQSFDTLKFKDGDSFESLLEKGKQLLAVYLKNFKGEAVRAVELPFRVPLYNLETGEFLDLPLDGYIDLIEADDTIVELKTAAKAFDAATLANHLQLTAYGYAYNCIYRKNPTFRLDSLIKTKNAKFEQIATKRERSDYVRFFHIAKEVLKGINCGYFCPNQGWMCERCEYSEPCRTWRG